MKAGNAIIEVVRGSVTDQSVDAIVNAANTTMRGGGGIDGLIHRLAGPGLNKELIEVAPLGAETGTPVVTGGHKLPQKFIIHVAGPRWRGGGRDEAEHLRACYRNSLEAASNLGLESIAFCSISTGVYGYPVEEAADLALETAISYAERHPESSQRRITFAMYGQREYEVFRRVYERMSNPDGSDH